MCIRHVSRQFGLLGFLVPRKTPKPPPAIGELMWQRMGEGSIEFQLADASMLSSKYLHRQVCRYYIRKYITFCVTFLVHTDAANFGQGNLR